MKEHFRLEPVLSHRKHIEDLAQKEFVDAGIAVQKADQTLREMIGRKALYENELTAQNGRGDVVRSVFTLRYLRRLQNEIRSQRDLVVKLETDREEKRTLLLHALKDRKAIEKLKEKHKAERIREDRRIENRLLDEVSVTRFSSRGSHPVNRNRSAIRDDPIASGNNFPEGKRLPQRDGIDPSLPPGDRSAVSD